MTPSRSEVYRLSTHARGVAASYLGIRPETALVSYLAAGADNAAFGAGEAGVSATDRVVVLVSRRRSSTTSCQRASEVAFLKWGGPLGVTPKLYAHGLTSGRRRFLVEEYICGLPLSHEDFRSARVQAELILMLRRLHTSGLKLPAAARAEDQLDQIVAALMRVSITACSQEGRHGRERLLRFVRSTAPEMKSRTASLEQAPTHHDLKPRNVMRKGEQLVLIDARPAALGLAYADVACAGLYFAPVGDLRAGLCIAADLYGVSRRQMKSYHAVAYLKLVRRAAAVLYTHVRAAGNDQSFPLNRLDFALADAERAYALAH